MDPSAGLLKEIAKRKAAPAQDVKKWKSRAEIEEECRIDYFEKEKEQEELQQAKKRRRIGPAPPTTVSLREESAKTGSDPSKDYNENTQQGTPRESVSHLRDQSDSDHEKTSKRHTKTSEGSSSESKVYGSDSVSRSTTAKDEEKPVSCREDQVHEQIRKYIRLWKSEIDQMPEAERKKTKGRSMVKTFEQTKTWLKPLERLLRKRKLKKTILDALRDIFDAVEEKDHMKASRLYLERLAIGNAPWPMGATMVGIHARAAREKIGEDKIAHVMNDEQTRKYIQGVKRLLTVAERNFPAP